MLNVFLQIVDTPEEQSRFEDLYYSYRKLMFYIASEILHDPGLAEDAVNEAFFRIAKNFSKINEVHCPRTRNFIVIIVRNISIDMVRRDSAGAVAAEEFVDTMAELPESRLEFAETKRVIRELPAIYRDVLLLFFVDGYETKEIAEFLGLRRETVKKRLQRGRVILQERLRTDE